VPAIEDEVNTETSIPTHDPMLQRVRGEYLEMPGLRLTCRQAQRLWGFDEHTCRGILTSLVEAGFLHRTQDGMYTRATEGRAAFTLPG
jgi:hypothetical protein